MFRSVAELTDPEVSKKRSTLKTSEMGEPPASQRNDLEDQNPQLAFTFVPHIFAEQPAKINGGSFY